VQTSFGGNDRLLPRIDAADCCGCRGAQHGACCTTQDRKYALGMGTTEKERPSSTCLPHGPPPVAAWPASGAVLNSSAFKIVGLSTIDH
jgi:hypothetical protein